MQTAVVLSEQATGQGGDREAVTIRLVSKRKLKRMQRKTSRHLQAKLFEHWKQYDN